MKRGISVALLLAATYVPSTRAQSAATPPPAASPPHEELALPDSSQSADASGGRFYGSAEYLIWWMRGASLPPLVTSSPAGTASAQAGLLGAPGTVVLFGQSNVNDDARSGMRFSFGAWIDNNNTLGIEGNFLMLEAKVARFAETSNGNPILARPFIDATTGKEDAERVAFPGDVTGSIDASATSDGLIGAGFLFRKTFCSEDGFRFDGLFGYRYLRLADRLNVGENLTSVNPNSPEFLLPGTQVRLADSFGAKNEFNGVDIGFAARWDSGPLAANLVAKMAVGPCHQAVDIDGSTTFVVPGTPPSTSSGGLLALPTNIGHHSQIDGPVIPELDFSTTYQLTSNIRVSVGYSLLYWPSVVRAASEVDFEINPTLLPNSTLAPTGPQRPAFSFQSTHLIAQGIDLGLEFRF